MLLKLLTGAAALFATAAAAATAGGSRCFPENFLFGSATAAYQVEGAWNEGGRTPSICDDFCRARPDVACANVADDFYHRYKEDIQLMVETGLKSFRFSISWSRAMNWDPETNSMKANPQGIAFYHELIDELNRNNITPLLTLYHWDLPSELQTHLSPGGWLNRKVNDHFVQFAELMFQEYGNKVDYWSTFNEPLSFALMGYGLGTLAPGLSGSDTDSYTVAHNVLLSHGRVVRRFRKLRADANVVNANARIGIVIPLAIAYPHNASNPLDVAAAERLVQFLGGWYLEPLRSGDYPAVMRERVGDRLPKFTDEEAEMVKGSYDLFMMNYYNPAVAADCTEETCPPESLPAGWLRDVSIRGMFGSDPPILPEGARWAGAGNDKCGMFSGYPQGYMDTMKWMHAFDTKADILLTENGWCGNETIDNQDQLWYYQTHVEQVYKAIEEEKIPVIGYTAWSLVDNYEWGSFKPRFGLYYVNWTSQTGSKEGYTPKPTDLARIPRTAAKWYAQVAKSNCLDVEISNVKATSASGQTSSWFAQYGVAGVVAVAAAIVVVRRVSTKRGSTGEMTPLL